mmetsp:Transcript_38371/g.105695  ORF Transcript_38371/g.105695 Transcript_38371/m.105695 type:complete len:296 (+) Transcript_38371:1566-2453(+)
MQLRQNWPSYQDPSGQVNRPWPSRMPSFHSPLYATLFGHSTRPSPNIRPWSHRPLYTQPSAELSNVPSPSCSPLTNSPAYQSPLGHTRVPLPWKMPFLNWPVNVSPEGHVISPSPHIMSRAHSPLYLRPFGQHFSPCPHMKPSRNSPAYFAPSLQVYNPSPCILPSNKVPRYELWLEKTLKPLASFAVLPLEAGRSGCESPWSPRGPHDVEVRPETTPLGGYRPSADLLRQSSFVRSRSGVNSPYCRGFREFFNWHTNITTETEGQGCRRDVGYASSPNAGNLIATRAAFTAPTP